MRHTRSELIAAAAAGLFAFALYFYSLPQVITGEDAGELTTAAFTLGIPHPPGYPTWCLLAHPFTWIPFGTVAWRVALSSAVFGALAVFMTSLIAARLTKNAPAALFAGVFLALTPSMYSQSIIADVYALNVLVLTSAILLTLTWDESRSVRPLYALALTLGLAQGVHNTAAIVAIITGLFVVLRDPALARQPRFVCGTALLFILGCATFLYLPIRSLANPVPDWGNPETMQAFLDHVLRKQFAFMYSQYPRSLESVSRQFLPLLFYVACAAFGAWLLRRRSPERLPQWLLISALGILPVAAILWVQNPLPDPQWRMVMTPFWIPAAVLFALVIGVVTGGVKQPRWYFYEIAILMVASIFMGYSYRVLPIPKNEYTYVDTYARKLLQQLPVNAILFPDADHAAFPILYLQQVEGLRPDVTLGNPYGYVDMSLLEDAPRDLLDRLGPRPRRGLEPEYFGHLLTHSKRPVYFSRRIRLADDLSLTFKQEFLLYRAVPNTEQAGVTPTWPEELREDSDSFGSMGLHADYTARAILAEFHAKRAEYFADTGDWERADQDVSASLEALTEVATLNNLATMLGRRGKYARAAGLLEEAVAMEPWNATLKSNLEKVRRSLRESDTSAKSETSEAAE